MAVGEGENASDLALVQPESFKGGADGAGLKRTLPALPALFALPVPLPSAPWGAEPSDGLAGMRPRERPCARPPEEGSAGAAAEAEAERSAACPAGAAGAGAGATARGAACGPAAGTAPSAGRISWFMGLSIWLAWKHDGGRFRSGGSGGGAQEALRHPEELGGMGDGALHIHRLGGGPAKREEPLQEEEEVRRVALGLELGQGSAVAQRHPLRQEALFEARFSEGDGHEPGPSEELEGAQGQRRDELGGQPPVVSPEQARIVGGAGPRPRSPSAPSDPAELRGGRREGRRGSARADPRA